MDDGQVDGEPVGGDADWVGVRDLANISLVGGGHELGDAGVETVQLLYVVRRVVHSLLGDLEALAILSGFPVPSAQPLHLPVLRLDDLLEGADPSVDRGGAVLEGLVVEGDDLLAMLAADLVR